MRKLFFLILPAILLFSCTKASRDESASPKRIITIEVQSETTSTIQVKSAFTSTFNGKLRQNFEAKDDIISVQLNSETPSIKSITIYVNDKMVAQRIGDCSVTNYDLSYNLNWY